MTAQHIAVAHSQVLCSPGGIFDYGMLFMTSGPNWSFSSLTLPLTLNLVGRNVKEHHKDYGVHTYTQQVSLNHQNLLQMYACLALFECVQTSAKEVQK